MLKIGISRHKLGRLALKWVDLGYCTAPARREKGATESVADLYKIVLSGWLQAIVISICRSGQLLADLCNVILPSAYSFGRANRR